MSSDLVILQIGDIARLLRATRFTLDRLIRRCKLRPVAVQRRKWTRMIFTIEDLGNLALAYWLYRSGLRTKAIQDVLATKEVEGLVQNLKNADTIETEGERFKFLITWRVLKPPTTGKTRPKEFGQKAALVKDFKRTQNFLEQPDQFGFLVVPLGRLLRELTRTLRGYLQQIEE